MNSNCPYCNSFLDKKITRKIDCKNCGKTIYVRNGNAVTEREKEILDWQRYMEFLVPDINEIRVTVEKDLSERFGKEPASGDLVWGMFNYIVLRLRKPSDLSLIYDNMAFFLESEGKQKNADDMKRMSLKMKISDFKTSGWEYKIKVINKDDDFVCVECKKINNKIMTLDQALADPPVPVALCINRKCRCDIDFVSNYESEEIIRNVKKEMNGKTISTKTNEDGSLNCPVCGENMGQPEIQGLFNKIKVYYCPSCKSQAKVK